MMNLHDRKVTRLGIGQIGAWSQNSQHVIYSRPIGPKGLSEVYQYNILQHTQHKLFPNAFNIADLVWNSSKNELYILDYAHQIQIINLASSVKTTYSFEDNEQLSIIFGLTRHNFFLDPAGHHLVLGYLVQDTLKICLFNLKTKKFELNEEFGNYRIKPISPFMIRSDLRYVLWPRIDGTYVSQTTRFYTNLEHELSHHHEHGKGHGEEDEDELK
jgi:hypothetical protein